MNIEFLLACLLNLAFIGAVIMCVLHAKRWLWAQIRDCASSLVDLRALTVQVRNDSLLAVVGDSLPLPA